MKYLTAEDILYIHFRLIEDYGGSHGIRDENRLKAVVAAPMQEVFGQEQYQTVYEKAAVYARNIIADHLFVDGNKRTGISSASIFMMKNGYTMTATDKELEDFAVCVPVEKMDTPAIASWLKKHTAKS